MPRTTTKDRVTLLERHVQDAIEQLCEMYGAKVLRNRSKRGGALFAQFDHPGNKGSPDLIVAWPHGRTWWIECKRPGEHMTSEQELWRIDLQARGHQHYCVAAVEQFEALLKLHQPHHRNEPRPSGSGLL